VESVAARPRSGNASANPRGFATPCLHPFASPRQKSQHLRQSRRLARGGAAQSRLALRATIPTTILITPWLDLALSPREARAGREPERGVAHQVHHLWPFFDFAVGTFGVEKGSMDPNKTGRRYDRQFKQDAVGLVQSGRTVVEVARDLGVSTWSLRHWVKRAQQNRLSEPKTLANETAEQRELRRLRLENDYLRRQRDIFKKALAIVSESDPSSDSK
jgi:transposase